MLPANRARKFKLAHLSYSTSHTFESRTIKNQNGPGRRARYGTDPQRLAACWRMNPHKTRLSSTGAVENANVTRLGSRRVGRLCHFWDDSRRRGIDNWKLKIGYWQSLEFRPGSLHPSRELRVTLAAAIAFLSGYLNLLRRTPERSLRPLLPLL